MAKQSWQRGILIVLDAFLAVTAVAGGIGILTGATELPRELLIGSPFSTYTIPALVLMVIVGGSALIAARLLVRQSARGARISAVSGVMIMGFEIVEVLIIGSDPGLARTLQVFYFTLGLVIAILAAWLWAKEDSVRTSSATHGVVW